MSLSLDNHNISVILCAPWNPLQKQLSHSLKVRNTYGTFLIRHLGKRTHARTRYELLNEGKLGYLAVHERARAKPTAEREGCRTGASIIDVAE